jgi:protocatechuate 3,4-dioxygenase beta subunit
VQRGSALHPRQGSMGRADRSHFTGAGRVITDAEGRYSFTTVRPGAYPWGNHHNAWRPSRIHLSLLGPAFATRLRQRTHIDLAMRSVHV